MSPSWRESLWVDIGAQQVSARRLSRGWRPRLLAQVQTAIAEPTPAAAAQALTAVLADLSDKVSGRANTARVLLSGDWVRFTLQPGASALHGSAERSAAAGHALRRVYGDAAAQWRISHCPVGPDVLLAAGIDAALHQQITAALAAGGATLASLRPSLALALNHCRPWLRQPTWLVAVEPGRAVLCFSDGVQLRSLRCHRLHDQALHSQLPAWLDQGRLLDGFAAPDAGVVVAWRGVAALNAAQLPAGARLVNLDAVGIPGAASNTSTAGAANSARVA